MNDLDDDFSCDTSQYSAFDESDRSSVLVDEDGESYANDDSMMFGGKDESEETKASSKLENIKVGIASNMRTTVLNNKQCLNSAIQANRRVTNKHCFK